MLCCPEVLRAAGHVDWYEHGILTLRWHTISMCLIQLRSRLSVWLTTAECPPYLQSACYIQWEQSKITTQETKRTRLGRLTVSEAISLASCCRVPSAQIEVLPT